MVVMKKFLLGALAASSCLASSLIPRTLMYNDPSSMKAFKELKDSDRPFLIGPGLAFEEQDVENLKEKYGCTYLGSFHIKNKFGQMKPVGEPLGHHIMNMPEGADKEGAEKYLMERKLNWIFDLRIPKTEGNVINMRFGPEGLPGLPKDELNIKWIKIEDRIIVNNDNGGPTTAFYMDIETPDAEFRVISSNYPVPGYLKDNADKALRLFQKLEKKGWYLLGTSRERFLIFSIPPKSTASSSWLHMVSGIISGYLTKGDRASWEKTAEEVYEEVKGFMPVSGPQRAFIPGVPHFDVKGNRLVPALAP